MRMNREDFLSSFARLFKTFSDPTRLEILILIAEKELCVCHIVSALKLPQSTVSRHLAYLKRSGLLETRETGRWNYYRLAAGKGDAIREVAWECLRGLRRLHSKKKSAKNGILCEIR